VEFGATWFHGTQGNPIYDLAVQHAIVHDPARAAQLGVVAPHSAPPARTAAATAAAQPPPDRWGVELVRPGEGAAVVGAGRAAAVRAMGAYGDALEELGEEEGAVGGGEIGTFGDVLRAQFDKVSRCFLVWVWRWGLRVGSFGLGVGGCGLRVAGWGWWVWALAKRDATGAASHRQMGCHRRRHRPSARTIACQPHTHPDAKQHPPSRSRPNPPKMPASVLLRAGRAGSACSALMTASMPRMWRVRGSVIWGGHCVRCGLHFVLPTTPTPNPTPTQPHSHSQTQTQTQTQT